MVKKKKFKIVLVKENLECSTSCFKTVKELKKNGWKLKESLLAKLVFNG